MSTTYSFQCWSCKTEHEMSYVGRGEICSSCRRDLRVCKNCRHYDPAFNNSCKETSADRVVDKEKSNFCDYFYAESKDSGSAASSKDSLLAAAEALFKKKN